MCLTAVPPPPPKEFLFVHIVYCNNAMLYANAHAIKKRQQSQKIISKQYLVSH